MALVQRLALEDSFDATNTFIPKGHVGTFDDGKITGKEPNIAHNVDVAKIVPSIVQVAPLGPTGPNPVNPQQLPPDAVQFAGGYAVPGATLVGEVTLPQKERIDAAGLNGDQSGQAQVAELMAEAAGGKGSTSGNANDALVEGSVADIVAELGGKTDAELEDIRQAEIDREKPRSTLLKAIDEEKAKRPAA